MCTWKNSKFGPMSASHFYKNSLACILVDPVINPEQDLEQVYSDL
jgi:hypothetical protein